MSIREIVSELPVIGDLLDGAELVDGIVELATGGAPEGYAALREKMEWAKTASGMDTRAAMLAAASEVPPVFNDNGEILAGQWTDPFTGFTSSDPSDFDIDHRVPFKAIVDSVPNFTALSLEEQITCFNDTDNLQVLHDGHNASKGDTLPQQYSASIADPSLREKFLNDCNRYMSKLGIRL